MQVLNGNMGEVLRHRRCMVSPAWRRTIGSRAGGHCVNIQKWAVCVTVTIEVNIKVTAVMPAFLTPPGSVPAPEQAMECHEAKLLSASICSIHQTLPGFIKFFPIPFPFSRQAVLLKSPFSRAKVSECGCLCGCVRVCASVLIFCPFHRVF